MTFIEEAFFRNRYKKYLITYACPPLEGLPAVFVEGLPAVFLVRHFCGGLEDWPAEDLMTVPFT
jgi:hypothetical protein